MIELGIQNLALLIVAGWILNITPGPDVFYMLTHALRSGWRAGVVAMFGICAGCLVHVSAAALGISALIAASATAFTVLKWVGAAYLIYVGIKMVMSKVTPITIDARLPTHTPHYLSIFKQGFWTNALNPKVALFFLAFLPQFITAQATYPSVSFLLLGLLFIVNSVPINLGYVLLGSWVRAQSALVQRGLHWIERCAGVLFIWFGLKLAISKAS